MASSNPSNENEVVIDISPIIKVYKDGKVERLMGDPQVPPSPEDPKTGVCSKDVSILENKISARFFIPKIKDDQKLPILIYFHGGGFCFQSAFSGSHHRFLNSLVKESNALAVSVEYRLAPESPLPIAYEDCWTALKWVLSHFDDEAKDIEKDPWLTKHGDFGRVFLGGDSAGGNIVHNMVMKFGTEKYHGGVEGRTQDSNMGYSVPRGVEIVGAILGFPYFWGSNPPGSMTIQENEESVPYRIWELVYPSAPGGIDNPMLNPFVDNAPSLENLGCSKVLVYTGEKDLLREKAIEYVEALKNSGWKGEVEYIEVEGEDHCFQIDFPDENLEKTNGLIKQMGDFIMLKNV
ncbi:hypothetical protein Leryth_002294 [Lithospermum erythrorhizon]|nr:hypothetical protein Leryth_002294 [Lithospermum erythrorhizon]